jgi:hypothetical protein
VNWWESAPLADTGQEWWKAAPLAENPAGEIPGAAPGTQAPAAQQTQRSMPAEVARQVGLTARAGAQGVGSLAGLLVDPITAVLNKFLPDSVQGNTVRAAAQELADLIGLPQPETSGERVVGAATEALASGGGLAAVAGRLAGATTGTAQTVARGLAAQPGQQLAGSAGSGAAAQSVAESGAGTGAQVAAALAGGMAGAAGVRQVGRTANPAQSAQDAALVRAADDAGVGLMTSDVIPPRTFVTRTMQTVGERIPVAGTGGLRERQQVERQEAVRQLLRQYGADVTTRNDERVAQELLRKRGADLTKYTTLKNSVISAVPGQAPVTRATAQIDNELMALQRVAQTPAVTSATNILQQYRQAIQGKTVAEIEVIRKQLGDELTAPDLASARSITEKIPSRVYRALVDDMGDHIKSTRGTRELTKWKVANARLSAMMGELDVTRLRTALRTGEDTPEAVSALLFSQKPSDVRRLYANLPPQGRAAARAAILARAMESAAPRGLDEISPTVFANNVQKLGTQVGVFFSRPEVERIDGLMRVLNATRRSGEFAANPPTGQQLALPVGAAVLTDIFGGFGAGIASAATIGGIARVIEKPAVTAILMQVRKTKPGSPEEMALAKRAVQAWQAQERSETPEEE